ncbi:hypothetical protein BU16DRAFT_614508 [Lophium mytilinum]|uniref:Uncharacterized protein n=1 Tax=Lophium mytilinum TaxID=390894 RepID=A0A6A6R8S5_9PEZI|nr:hypothetical protein BU16DRAFT_614508 [Lophium mytilinum]
MSSLQDFTTSQDELRFFRDWSHWSMKPNFEGWRKNAKINFFPTNAKLPKPPPQASPEGFQVGSIIAGLQSLRIDTDVAEAVREVAKPMTPVPPHHAPPPRAHQAKDMSGFNYYRTRPCDRIVWFPKRIPRPTTARRYVSSTIPGIEEVMTAMEKWQADTHQAYSMPSAIDEDADTDMANTEDPEPILDQHEPILDQHEPMPDQYEPILDEHEPSLAMEQTSPEGPDLGVDAMEGLDRADSDMTDALVESPLPMYSGLMASEALQPGEGSSSDAANNDPISTPPQPNSESTSQISSPSFASSDASRQSWESPATSSTFSLSPVPFVPLTFGSSTSSAATSESGPSRRAPAHAGIEVEPLQTPGCLVEYDTRIALLNRLYQQFDRLNGTMWRNAAYKKSALSTTEMNKCAQKHEKRCASHGEVINNPQMYQDLEEEIWEQLGLEGMSPLDWKNFCEKYREEETQLKEKTTLSAQVPTSTAPRVAIPGLNTTPPVADPWSASYTSAQYVPPSSATSNAAQSNLAALLQSLVPATAPPPAPAPTLPGLSPTELLNILTALNASPSTTPSNSASAAQAAAQPPAVVAPPPTMPTAQQTTATAAPVQPQLVPGSKRGHDSGPEEGGEDPAPKVWKGGEEFSSRVR